MHSYINDKIISSQTWEEHQVHVCEVLQRLYILVLKLIEKVPVLHGGMRVPRTKIGNGSVDPEDSMVRVIREFLKPHTKRGIRSFLGLTGYYRKFIAHYSTVTTPLTNLTCKCVNH